MRQSTDLVERGGAVVRNGGHWPALVVVRQPLHREVSVFF